MTQNSVKPTAKEAVKIQIAETLRRIERKIAKMTETMNSGYLHFFEWQAEEMFKTQKRRSFFAELERAVENVAEDAWKRRESLTPSGTRDCPLRA